MAKKLYEESNIQGIADAIRYANGGSDTYMPSEMAAGVRALKKTLISKSISENGDYSPASDSADGYSAVHVSVPSSAPAVLVSKNINQNGTYIALDDDSADGYSQVIVNIPSSVCNAVIKVTVDTAYSNLSSCNASKNGTTISPYTVIEGVNNCIILFLIPEAGEWTVSVVKSGRTTSESETVALGDLLTIDIETLLSPDSIDDMLSDKTYAYLSETVGDQTKTENSLIFTRMTDFPAICCIIGNSCGFITNVSFLDGSNSYNGFNMEKAGVLELSGGEELTLYKQASPFGTLKFVSNGIENVISNNTYIALANGIGSIEGTDQQNFEAIIEAYASLPMPTLVDMLSNYTYACLSESVGDEIHTYGIDFVRDSSEPWLLCYSSDGKQCIVKSSSSSPSGSITVVNPIYPGWDYSGALSLPSGRILHVYKTGTSPARPTSYTINGNVINGVTTEATLKVDSSPISIYGAWAESFTYMLEKFAEYVNASQA